MSRRSPEGHTSRRERRCVGRLALVLWFCVLSIVLAAVAGPVLGAAGGGAWSGHAAAGPDTPPERVKGDRTGAATPLSAASEDRSARAKGLVASVFPDADFSFDLTRGSGLDVRIGNGWVDARLLGLGGEDGRQTATISHGAIDEGVARSASAGLCAAGLQGSDSPLSLDVDAENASVTAELASESVDRPDRTTPFDPATVVRSCTNESG